jgi:hypothetical protein
MQYFHLTSSLVLILTACIGTQTQRVAPGVPPQQYQGQQQHQQYQPPPPQQHQQQQQPPPHQHQGQYQQQVPQQFQQPPAPAAQQHQPVQHQQQVHHGQAAPGHGHAHGQQRPGQLLDASNVGQERDHIKEHMPVPIDTSQMSEQELQFHYFKMHDADGNHKLDGCELVKSLVHWHDAANHDPASGQPAPEAKIFKDDELINMIDPILANDDKNNDGYIDYMEFVQAQANVAARGGSPPPQQH